MFSLEKNKRLVVIEEREICSRARLASEWFECVENLKWRSTKLDRGRTIVFILTMIKITCLWICFVRFTYSLISVRCLFCLIFSHDVYDV